MTDTSCTDDKHKCSVPGMLYLMVQLVQSIILDENQSAHATEKTHSLVHIAQHKLRTKCFTNNLRQKHDNTAHLVFSNVSYGITCQVQMHHMLSFSLANMGPCLAYLYACSPVSWYKRVGNHDGFQMESAISHKHNGISRAGHNRGCAAQNLTCTAHDSILNIVHRSAPKAAYPTGTEHANDCACADTVTHQTDKVCQGGIPLRQDGIGRDGMGCTVLPVKSVTGPLQRITPSACTV